MAAATGSRCQGDMCMFGDVHYGGSSFKRTTAATAFTRFYSSSFDYRTGVCWHTSSLCTSVPHLVSQAQSGVILIRSSTVGIA